MIKITNTWLRASQTPFFGLTCASLILAVEPVRWLAATWMDQSYQSTGAVYGLAILCLIGYSASSPVRHSDNSARRHAIALLFFSAMIRLAGQSFAINILGGVALALDVYAILTLFRMPHRARPVSPFWVSVLFLFTLPIERIMQRILGYPMQENSASIACNLLGLGFENLVCEGVRIQVQGQDVLVDLPCSGTASLILSLALIVALNAIRGPKFSHAVMWVLLTIVLSILGNALRISLIAVALVYRDTVGFDVMSQPAHDILGYATIALSLLAILIFHKGSAPLYSRNKVSKTLRNTSSSDLPKFYANAATLGSVVLALIIVNAPRQALDVSGKLNPLYLPSTLADEFRVPQKLLPREAAYFEQFGGQAKKALYGDMALTLVETTSPLRHLHAPDDCLRGLGYDVTFLGTRFAPVPTALYRATDSLGNSWHVAVTFTSDKHHITSNVAEAIWQWLASPATHWSSVQRITPWEMEPEKRQRLEAAVITALDLPESSQI